MISGKIIIEQRIDDLIARLEDLFSEFSKDVPPTEQENSDIKIFLELRTSFDLNNDLNPKELSSLNEIAKRNLP